MVIEMLQLILRQIQEFNMTLQKIAIAIELSAQLEEC